LRCVSNVIGLWFRLRNVIRLWFRLRNADGGRRCQNNAVTHEGSAASPSVDRLDPGTGVRREAGELHPSAVGVY